MRDEANQQHQEAMQKQQIFMQQQMDERIAAMTAQFQNMMAAAAAGATGQHQPPPHSPSNDAWMDAVDISDQPVPDGAGSSWIGLCEASFVDSVDYCIKQKEEDNDVDWLPPSLIELGKDLAEGWQFVESLHE